MQALGLNEIREKFLSFFESKQHLRLPSFSLVPQDDPSILLINAGMTPLKPYFTGAQTPPSLRITTSQKCIRTPDIDRVGLTSRHATYFEMLGNFSFGDYFKEEIIPWAWEFCTIVLEMDPERLYPSVYLEDDEAFDIWRDKVGVPAEKITRLGKADNFWEHGTGPCGPCSEIYYDRGAVYGCNDPACAPGCDCDRFVEFWNLVFTQFDRKEDGTYVPLEKKNIDTGAGLERIACIMQGVDSLFEVDTVRKILDTICEKTGVQYGKDPKADMGIRVITDHVRSTTMMISDGILPSNEGRGYVLRRLLRRAIRFGRMLGIKTNFLTEIAAVVIELNRDAYPALIEKQTYIMTVLRQEEESFMRTLEQGTQILNEYISMAKNNHQTILPGEQVFRLHDTYGFPLDLTREIASDEGLQIDEEGFRAEMQQQKETARKASLAKSDTAWGGKKLPERLLADKSSTEFVGYDKDQWESPILYLLKEDEEGVLQIVDEVFSGDDAVLIVGQSPFYAASGGQEHDEGLISDACGFIAQVNSVDKDSAGKFLHGISVREGHVKTGATVTLSIDRERRLAGARNHTSTHLLQRALRKVLGDHVEQAGSLVNRDRLRFDFTHFQPVQQEELIAIEKEVNRVILQDLAVQTRVMPIQEARKIGAMALFGEKYGETVRVVSIGDENEAYSVELCGGTHLSRTSQAAQLRILSETGIASGVRRIEAVTGEAAYAQVAMEHQCLRDLSDLLKVPSSALSDKIQSLTAQIRALDKEISALHRKSVEASARDLLADAMEVQGVRILAAQIEAQDADTLRNAADKLRDSLGSSIVLLGSVAGDKLLFVSMASPEAVKKGAHAGNVICETAKAAGGGGGGRPDMAQAGGKDITKIAEALRIGKEKMTEQLA